MMEAGDDISHGDITAMVPVNLRPPDKVDRLGNDFALVYLSLPVSLEDPLDRLTVTKYHMDVLKSSPEPFLIYQILGLIGALPPEVAKQATTWFSSKASAVLTNVPGPRQQLYLAGIPIKNLMFWVPQSGEIGLGISIMSYNGMVTLGIMVDDGLVSNPQLIMDGFEIELQAMERGIVGRQASPVEGAAEKGPSRRGKKTRSHGQSGRLTDHELDC